ncbi:MAG: efflux RND transporter periplasmic adaptor subunit [Candidatus Abyssobacteria bacterium SURF_5]|uniref:Efflux RND transporter periplasmic adaptor subunit n=1 Tax=Abyssobacteria bacterium (strain SURF_5) TaxID=2093360 RepID=A0A3A4P3Q7_ABYX5|nr:MAG: efflux RND transporter periplasmic adaptor subunit [Candidatus Abyssubacteria bacterium SURF_5]
MNNNRQNPKQISEKIRRILSVRERMKGCAGWARTAVAGILFFALGIGLTLFILANPLNIDSFEKAKQALLPQPEAPATADSGGRKIKYWRAPMDPTYTSDKPGKSPMGMDLVPVYEDGAEEEADNVIRINPATIQNIGVVTDTVERGDLRMKIRTVGTLDYNEERVFWVNTKYDGWIEKVYINYIGQKVRKGEPLFEIYSPDLVSTQEEYLSALKYRDNLAGSGYAGAEGRAESLLEASRGRLRNWDISDRQIQNLEETGKVKKTLTVVSPVTGVVTEKMDQALEGMYAKAGMNLYRIADLSSLWVHVDLYEYQLPWVQEGQEAKIEIASYPGEIFKGKVRFFYPYVDEKTRTNKVSIEIPNRDEKLRPQMFATVTFTPVAAKGTVLVPGSAVLHSGERDVVVLDIGGGRFEPREVTLGLQGDNKYQVLKGLEGGEKIVTSSQFLIDSESNLREAINKMLMARRGAATESMDTEQSDHAAMEEKKSIIDEPQTRAALNQVVESYLPLWRTLAADSKEGVSQYSEKLAGAAAKAADVAASADLQSRLVTLQQAAKSMKADDVDQARESFKEVSRALVAIFETYKAPMQDTYVIIECPMLKEKWIQDSEEVRNPYYGSAMLNCGEVVENLQESID